MRAVVVSLVLVVAGIIASRAVTTALTRRGGERDEHVAWALGLVALVPGWVAALIGLLGAEPVRRPEAVVAVVWTLSTALALLGTIATEAIVRRAAVAGDPKSPEWQWRMGVLTLVPALAVALIGHLLR